MMGSNRLCAALVVFAAVTFALIPESIASIEKFSVTSDERNKFYIGQFGYRVGGEFHIQVSDFRISKRGTYTQKPPRIGVMVKKSQSDVSGFLEQNIEIPCLFDKMESQDMEISMFRNLTSSQTLDYKLMKYSFVVSQKQEALYTFYFVNCEPYSKVSYSMLLKAYNPGPIYLSYGEELLPSLYFSVSLIYTTALIFWIRYLLSSQKKVFLIHYVMAVFLTLKALSTFFQSIVYHQIKLEGDSSGWNIPFYIFDFMKGVMVFVVIILIGTGWTLMKSFFSERDKRLIMIVIPLQILANTAMVIIEETAPGSEDWMIWFNLLRFIDIVCCGAVLFPIIWSIKHLREGSETDGKATKNIERLTLFRQFYIMVVSYIYFTRIIKYLLDATLPYHLIWLSTFFSEATTFIFSTLTGYLFRPVPDNPYLKVDSDDEGDVPMNEMSELDA